MDWAGRRKGKQRFRNKNPIRKFPEGSFRWRVAIGVKVSITVFPELALDSLRIFSIKISAN
jgi:hypothetical protein